MYNVYYFAEECTQNTQAIELTQKAQDVITNSNTFYADDDAIVAKANSNTLAHFVLDGSSIIGYAVNANSKRTELVQLHALYSNLVISTATESSY